MAVNAPILVVAHDVLKGVQDDSAASGLWLVFSKCKTALNDGRRLENMSWRLWHREMQMAPFYRPITPDSPCDNAEKECNKSHESRFARAASRADTASQACRKSVGKMLSELMPGLDEDAKVDKPDGRILPVSLPTPSTELVSISIVPPAASKIVGTVCSESVDHHPHKLTASSPMPPTVVILKPTPNPTPHPTPPASPLLPATIPQDGAIVGVDADSPNHNIQLELGAIARRRQPDSKTKQNGTAPVNAFLKPADGRMFSISPTSDSSDDSTRTSSSSDSSHLHSAGNGLPQGPVPTASDVNGGDKADKGLTDTEVESDGESVAVSERSRSSRVGKKNVRPTRSGSRGKSDRKGLALGSTRGRRKAHGITRQLSNQSNDHAKQQNGEQSDSSKRPEPTDIPKPSKPRASFKIGSNSPSGGSRSRDDDSVSPVKPPIVVQAQPDQQEQGLPQARAHTEPVLPRTNLPPAALPRNTSRAGLSTMMQAQLRMTAGNGQRQQPLTPVKELPVEFKGKDPAPNPPGPSKAGVLPPTDTVAGLAAAEVFVKQQGAKQQGRQVAVIVTDSDEWTSADEDEDEDELTDVEPSGQTKTGPTPGKQAGPHRAPATAKGKGSTVADSRLTDAALEAQRQRDLFQRAPKTSYAELPRTGSGLLSQLMNPDPNIFPPNHPYRRGYSSGDVGRVARLGLLPQQPSPDQSRTQPSGLSQRAPIPPPAPLPARAPAPPPAPAPPEAPAVTQTQVPTRTLAPLEKEKEKKPAKPPRRTGSTSSISTAPRGFQPSKSLAATPIAAQVTAGITATATTSQAPTKVVAFADMTPQAPTNRPGLKRHHTSEAHSAVFSTKGKEKATHEGGYRPRGAPQEQEMEDESEEDEKDAIQLSKSVAQRRLEALASRHSKRPSKDEKRRSSGASSSIAQQTSPKFDDLPPWAAAAIKQPEEQNRRAAAPPARTQREAVEQQQQQQGATQTAPIGQLAYPYCLPSNAEPSTPRTTRRMMMRTEMSESLRQNLLWSRQQSRADLVGPQRKNSANLPADRLPSAPLPPPVVKLTRKANNSTATGFDTSREPNMARGSSNIQRNKSMPDTSDFHVAGW